ncbi:peptidoglycan-binding protein LysM, partial [Rhizobium ruizarguesonis]
QAPNLTDTSSAGAATPSDKANLPDVMVNAVEIEGNKIFIAGTTRPNEGALFVSEGTDCAATLTWSPAGRLKLTAARTITLPAGST